MRASDRNLADPQEPLTATAALAATLIHLFEARERVGGRVLRSFNELISLAVRKVDEVAPLNVTEKAQEAATGLGLGDLRRYCWFCPPMKKHRHGDHRLFLWEHFTPAKDLENAVLRLGRERTQAQVEGILREAKMVWVHRDEATAIGNGSRPDPAATYRVAEANLLFAWDECEPVRCPGHGSVNARSRSPRAQTSDGTG